MAEMFSDEWMKGFMEQWNAETDLSEALAQIGFNSVIAYGFEGEPSPKGVLNVQNGKAVEAGAYSGQTLNWDIRCKKEQWEKMIAKPPGMMGLGTAFATGKMKFAVGDYTAMIKDPRMAGPFIKSFSVMGRVKV
jgi:putative sterol carrier protein